LIESRDTDRFSRRIPIYPGNLLPIAAVGGAGVGIRLLQEDLSWLQVLGWSVAGVAAVSSLLAVLVLLPFTGEGTRVRLTNEELIVGRRRMRLQDVIEVRTASHSELSRAQLFRWRMDDMRISFMGKKIAFGTTQAVFIRINTPKRRPWLLVDVGDSDGFVSLIMVAKEDAGGRL
jgi:hypothetical protein